MDEKLPPNESKDLEEKLREIIGKESPITVLKADPISCLNNPLFKKEWHAEVSAQKLVFIYSGSKIYISKDLINNAERLVDLLKDYSMDSIIQSFYKIISVSPKLDIKINELDFWKEILSELHERNYQSNLEIQDIVPEEDSKPKLREPAKLYDIDIAPNTDTSIPQEGLDEEIDIKKSVHELNDYSSYPNQFYCLKDNCYKIVFKGHEIILKNPCLAGLGYIYKIIDEGKRDRPISGVVLTRFNIYESEVGDSREDNDRRIKEYKNEIKKLEHERDMDLDVASDYENQETEEKIEELEKEVKKLENSNGQKKMQPIKRKSKKTIDKAKKRIIDDLLESENTKDNIFGKFLNDSIKSVYADASYYYDPIETIDWILHK